jgi:hypothetical protein
MRSAHSDHLLSLWETVVIASGAGLGMCWVGFMTTERWYMPLTDLRTWLVYLFAAVAGMTMAGALLVLIARFRMPNRWRAGTFLLCALGLGCWVFMPMLIIAGGKFVPVFGRLNLADFVPLQLKSQSGHYAEAFYFHVLPLFALLLSITCALGGRPSPRWWKCECWWPEWFGMYISSVWALAGLWVVFQAYFKTI